MPRFSFPIDPQCVKLQELGWNSSKLTDDDRRFKDHVRSLFYNVNALCKHDNNRIEQLKLALQFDITGEDTSKQIIFTNVTINDMNQAIKSGEPRYMFECPMMSDVSNCVTIRLSIGSGKSIFCKIEDTVEGFVFFNPCDPDIEFINTRIGYNVAFMPNDLLHCFGYEALEKIDSLMLSDYFRNFDQIPINTCQIQSDPRLTRWENNFYWINKNIEDNEEQKTAVQSIVNCKSRPFPFIVFGPPGTGKTTVLVEAVLQIMRRKPSSRVLITAQSNSACNEICARLINLAHPNDLLRLFSRSIFVNEADKIPSDIKSYSDYVKNSPSQRFNGFKIIITTLVTSYQLKDQGQFDFIFIDECASASEPEALIPIMAHGVSESKITAHLILLGDHKQLGPVINSRIAVKLGLGVSLMERIMSKPRYLGPDFDTKYVVQLLDNYRSHPAILEFSNKNFYNSKLRAKMSEDEKRRSVGWNYLPNKSFPLLFHAVEDSSEIDRNGSSFNTTEAVIIRNYIGCLIKEGINGRPVTAGNIGVVTPYTAQNKILKEILENTGVESGTTEYFQGREKEIMIVSTVRSQSSTIGFLSNQKRLNVMMTRAKYLLIIIGNPETLEKDPMWKNLVDYCIDNGAVCDRIDREMTNESRANIKKHKKIIF